MLLDALFGLELWQELGVTSVLGHLLYGRKFLAYVQPIGRSSREALLGSMRHAGRTLCRR